MVEVSVVVPIYNAGKKLDKCIKSILNQTFKDFELILVNDGSTDNSIKICRKYELKDSRVKVIDKENEGSIATRNLGIKKSIGNYITFVDADDYISLDAIEKLYKDVKEMDLDIVVCNTYKVIGDRAIIKQSNNSHYFSKNMIYEGDDIKDKLAEAYLHGHPFPASIHSKLYKKELLLNSGKYLDRIKFLGDDLYYNLEMFLKAKKVKVISEPLYYYRTGGFTSKYMPYHIYDIVNGYEIQKEVIEQYYMDTKEESYKGISIMLLNSLKTSLYNVNNSDLMEKEIKSLIESYVNNPSIIEASKDKGSIEYFDKQYLDAILNKNIGYLYKLGKEAKNKQKFKSILINLATKSNLF